MTVTHLIRGSLACWMAVILLGSAAADDEAIRRVENGLKPEIVLKDQPVPVWTLAERMAKHNVPGVSIAVINDGKIQWTKGYGVLDASGDQPVDCETLFQAASISKPVAAAGALRLVDAGRLDLDEPVNEQLRSWKVPDSELTQNQPVTLRELLSHTAGLTVHGFPGYAADQQVPTTVQVLDGEGNTAPVRVDIKPGTEFRYSGGGYTIAQLLMADVGKRSFPELMQETILEPAGMSHSTFHQPLPDALRSGAATAHNRLGKPVVGKWNTYPEMAAAGLWTTPSDLARFLLEIRRAARGESEAILSEDTAKAMLTPEKSNYGLGMAMVKEDSDLRFGHGGSNRGFRCEAWLHLDSGDGVVVMTNSDQGSAIAGEVYRAVADVYDWPDRGPVVKELAMVDQAVLDSYAGKYGLEDGSRVTIQALEGKLSALVPGAGKYELLPESETMFFSLEPGIPAIEFLKDASGAVTALSFAGTVAKKIDREGGF